MKYMFSSSDFNNGVSCCGNSSPSINNWDVSNVTNMEGMFAQASYFSQNIGNWDVSNVTNMNYMFHGATYFDSYVPSDLSGWCVQNLPYLPYQFAVNSSLENDHLPIWGTCP